MAPAAQINVESRIRRDLITKTRTLSYRDYFSPFIAIQGADPDARLGRLGLTVVLFLIGTSLSKDTLRRVGVRPFIQGVCLWVIVATASFLAIRAGWITL